MQIVLLELDVGILLLDVGEKLAFLAELFFVGLGCAPLLLYLHELDLLPLQFLGGLVKSSIAIACLLGREGLSEEVVHRLVEQLVWIVQVVDHVIELALSLQVLRGGALLPLEVSVIEALVQGAAHVLRDAGELCDWRTWLIVAGAETRVELVDNRRDRLSWMLQALCQP